MRKSISASILDVSASPERPVHGRSRLGLIRKQEREIGDADGRDAIGEVAARLVAERQDAALDEPDDVVGAIAEVEDVVDVLDVDLVAELR